MTRDEPQSLGNARDIRYIKGVPFPAEVKYRQLIITGPPGCGKSRLVRRIGGWPEEGYVDLTLKGWWRAQSLTFRPREVHLGFPFAGHSDALTVFDREWLEAPLPLELDPHRILLPPRKTGLLSTNWRARYAFEFFLPPAEEILQWRRARRCQGSHPGDSGITLTLVERQLTVYRAAALLFRESGILTYVRDKLDEISKTPVGTSQPAQ